jgi:hypothetical protein
VSENTVGNFEKLGRKLEYKGHLTPGTITLFPGNITQHCITAKRKYLHDARLEDALRMNREHVFLSEDTVVRIRKQSCPCARHKGIWWSGGISPRILKCGTGLRKQLFSELIICCFEFIFIYCRHHTLHYVREYFSKSSYEKRYFNGSTAQEGSLFLFCRPNSPNHLPPAVGTSYATYANLSCVAIYLRIKNSLQ